MAICRRAEAAGIETTIGNPTFRATGITAYLKNGGQLETAAAMATCRAVQRPASSIQIRRVSRPT